MSASRTVVHVETGRHLYGGALQVIYLLRGLKQHGYRNILVCPQGSDIAVAAKDVAERVHALPMGGDTDLGFIARLRRVLRTERPALVHLHSRRGADVLGGIAARLEKIPVVLTRRVDNPEPRLFVRYKYRLYDRVIAISHGIQRVLESEGVPAEKLACVPSAVDTDKFRPGCRHERFKASFGFAPEAQVVGMVAQLIPRKGHRHLFQAAPAVFAAVPWARFVLFGQGPLDAALKSQAAKFNGRIVLAGFRPDLDTLLPCLDVLVHPAELEGLGVSLLQAAACAVPIVAAPAGGIPEIVRDGVNGFLVPAADHARLAERLVTLLRDPALARRLGAAGRNLAEREFSLAAMVEGNLRVYRELLGA